MSISRLYDFTPNTLILSAEVDAELDQLVAEVNKMFMKDGSENLSGDLTINKANPALIFEGTETNAKSFRIRSDGGLIDFDVDDSGYTTMFSLDLDNDQVLVTSGLLTLDTGIVKIDTDLDDGGTPTANSLYADNICKAWALIDADSGGGEAIIHEFNITSMSREAAGRYRMTFATAMNDDEYVVIAIGIQGNTTNCLSFTRTSTYFEVSIFNSTNGAAIDQDFACLVIGRQ